jgi:hypothetical protein
MSTPASTMAPRIMSPLMPEKQSKYAIFIRKYLLTTKDTEKDIKDTRHQCTSKKLVRPIHWMGAPDW